ncbi:UNVERIFIED_CONTAM: Cytoplasmic phosphatidylinositol transfer protein 1 [Gekko kuhli]
MAAFVSYQFIFVVFIRIFDNEAKDLDREVCFIDIACDEIPERYYKESEDPKYFKSEKTGRGLLKEGWRETQQPIMCSYKLVSVKFEVWGLQTRVEQFVHKYHKWPKRNKVGKELQQAVTQDEDQSSVRM